MLMSKREPLFPPAFAAVANALYKAAGKGIPHPTRMNTIYCSSELQNVAGCDVLFFLSWYKKNEKMLTPSCT
jgi:hypothetical protein